MDGSIGAEITKRARIKLQKQMAKCKILISQLREKAR